MKAPVKQGSDKLFGFKDKINMGLRIFVLTCLLLIAFAAGAITSFLIIKKPNSIRLSITGVNEIMSGCGGDYKDLAANANYIYANCGDGTPITVQNYVFK